LLALLGAHHFLYVSRIRVKGNTEEWREVKGRRGRRRRKLLNEL